MKTLEQLTTTDDLKDFIEFLDAIPPERWCVDLFQDDIGRCCFQGHLGRGLRDEDEEVFDACDSLETIIGGRNFDSLIGINNGVTGAWGICEPDDRARREQGGGGVKHRVLTRLRELAK